MRIALLLLAALTPLTITAPAQSTPVRAITLGELASTPGQEIAAQVVPDHDSLLAAELAAVVTEVPVEVGSRVDKGQVLLRLEHRDTTLQLQQARAAARAASARAELASQRRRRGEELAPKGHLSADELLALRAGESAANADLAAAEAALALATRMQEKTVLRAPFAGEVLERHAQLGAMASPGQPLLRLVGLDGEVEAAMPALQADRLDGARDFRFHYAGRDYPLAIARVGSVIDPAARARMARLRFVGEPAPAGSSGQLRWREAGHVLPAELLVERGGTLGVFLVEAGHARFHPLPQALPGRSALLDLPADTVVVTSGQQSLQDGMAVAVDGAP